uniref:Pectinesterase n=1 Tax=Leersia perrieri TaxID=77586 RepID=A0A0D9XTS7_9ORYZ
MASMNNSLALLLLLIILIADHCLPTAAVAEHGYGSSTPSWVNPRLRRLLRGTAHGELEVTVAKDGSGDYTTIAAAVAAAPNGKERYTVRIREGKYHEQFVIGRRNVALFGDGMDKTVITASHGTPHGGNTSASATVTAIGGGFMARDLTIENTAGLDGNQSVALRSNSEHAVLYRCRLQGFQDTLYAENKLQFYLDCEISGTVDFIFGDAKAVFQGCRLLVRRPRNGAHNVITAQGRNDLNKSLTGFSFQNCSVIAMPKENLTGVETYLGRPWRNLSHVIFMQSFLSDIVHPSGWVHWNKSSAVAETARTVSYMEYDNWGPGANTSQRVDWEGFSKVTDAKKAEEYTVDRFINGSEWLPKNIVYKHGL